MCIVLGVALVGIFTVVKYMPFMSDDSKIMLLYGQEGIDKNMTLQSLREEDGGSFDFKWNDSVYTQIGVTLLFLSVLIVPISVYIVYQVAKAYK
jgi:hypothetical protein